MGKFTLFRLCVTFRSKLVLYGKELLGIRPITKLEDQPLSIVRDCLFNIFAASVQMSKSGGCLFHPQTENVTCRGDRDPHNMVPVH